MNEIENKNRETRIKQQKQSFFRKLILCITAILVITLISSIVNKNSRGTEIDLNTFEQKLDAGQIKEINLNEERIQIYYLDGEPHWLFTRGSVKY